MAELVVGSIVLIVDGVEHDCTSCTHEETTGVRPVPTMNRKMRTKYVAKGAKAWSLNIETVVPLAGSINWSEVEEARVSIEDPDGNVRTTFLDCYPQTISTATNNGDTSRSIALFALDKVDE